MFWLFLVVIFLIGTLQPIQTSANSRAKDYLGSPIVASLCNFMVGTLLTLALALIVERGVWMDSEALSRIPWWAWLGGAAGVVGITANILLFPKLGSMQTVLMPMVGQILSGFLIDSFGLFRSAVYPVSVLRLIGFAVVLAGVFLAVTRDGRNLRVKGLLAWQLLGICGGAVLAMQPAINSQLALGAGSPLKASFISFACGFALLLVICSIFKGHRENIVHIVTVRRPLWTWVGGLCGVICVVGQTYLVKTVGVGLLTILNIFGMLACSVLIDHFGLLGASRRPVTGKRALGLALVLAGIVLLNIRPM